MNAHGYGLLKYVLLKGDIGQMLELDGVDDLTSIRCQPSGVRVRMPVLISNPLTNKVA